MTHKLAEPYSGKNPVPKIATKITSLVNPEKATAAKVRQLQDQSDKHEEKETEKTASTLAKGRTMHVTEPTTGEEVDISNAAEEPDLSSKGENVLRHHFPPPDLAQHRKQVLSVTSANLMYISAAYILSAVLSHLLCTSFVAGCLFVLPPSILAYSLLFHIQRTSEGDFDDRAWHAERMRGLRAGSDVDGNGQVSDEERSRESAEWANTLLRGVWPIVNPDIFVSMLDIVEDIMQSSAPSFVHSVRIANMGLGSNAARITAIRSLPDASKPESGLSASDNIGDAMQVDTQPIDGDDREALDGDHVNLEVAFAYRGLPSGQSVVRKARNIHLLVEFFLGMRGVFGFKFPVWVEVTGAVGTARIRLQLISNPPFVKTTLVTLMGLPHVTISVLPLSEKLPNVMNIPFISGFVSSAINTAAAEYVAPKSLTMDLQKLISGDDIKKDTDAIGVIVVHIHRATGVKGMDTGGSSDPYVTLTYSRLGKPLYSTRIIKGDRNPVFEETAVLMVDVNTVRLREKLSFQLWDSDRMSVDDMLGFHEVDIVERIRQRSQPARRVSPLSSPDSRNRPGCIEYTIGYYGKRPPNTAFATDGADPGIPGDLHKAPEFQQAHGVALNDLEAAVLTTPPDPEWPSGLLSMQVHEIRELVVRAAGRHNKEREGGKGQDEGQNTREEGEGLPSSYCVLSLNDELIYETRVKPITSSPMFNAGTERFVRDWRKAHVTVTVKDSRMRENDAVLGIVFLKLSELFVNASQVTRVYSLEEGVGHGRIRISLLFRPVDAKLPPNLLGFDTGTIELRDISVRSEQDFSGSEIHLKMTTSSAEQKISRQKAEARDDGTVVWSSDGITSIPVRQRYGSALLFSFKDAAGFKSAGRKALAVLWLRDLVDHEEGPVEIALWHARHGDYSRLKLNYVPADGNLDYWDSDKEKVEQIGSVHLNIVFKPGISKRHHEMLGGAGAKKRGAWDEYDREQAAGMRDTVGEMDEKMPSHHQAEASSEPQRDEGQQPEAPQTDRTITSGPLSSAEGDTDAVAEKAQEGVNTDVPSEKVEDQVPGPKHRNSRGTQDSGSVGDADDTEASRDGSGGSSGGKKGLVGQFKDWRQHEKELHRDHRGLMQAKPARTVQWMKDNVEEGVHGITSSFKMKARQPGVETEV